MKTWLVFAMCSDDNNHEYYGMTKPKMMPSFSGWHGVQHKLVDLWRLITSPTIRTTTTAVSKQLHGPMGFKKWACGWEGGLADCRKDQHSWQRALKYVRKRIKADKDSVNTYNIFDLRITMWSIASPFKFEIKYFILFYASLSLAFRG